MDRLRRLPDPRLGDWVNARLLDHAGDGCRAGSVVPTGFQGVVRVLHPVGDGRSWAQVATDTGKVMHPLVQWCCIAETFDGGGRDGAVDPEEGSVPKTTLEAILDHCPSNGELVQAVWAGFGSWTDVEDERAVMPGWGGRTYFLFATTNAAVMTWPGMAPAWPQSANMIWPKDHSWCIATEIDWDSTLVAGPQAVVDAILGDTRLEAFAVGYDDDLSWHGDTVNPRPAWLTQRFGTA